MSNIKEALIWGVENPPRDYTPEEWSVISEFADYVANNYGKRCSGCGKVFKDNETYSVIGDKDGVKRYCSNCVTKALVEVFADEK